MRLSAMYLDFDNFFGGLFSSDPQAALALMERPSVWLERLKTAQIEESRRLLVMRCYLNPAGWVADPREEGARLYFSKFRPFFVQAGFEVVDCPALTRGSKNAADIRIVIDVMTALNGPARYDEFVLLSSDADFTPLLQVVRAHGRLATVVAASPTAAAYQSLADHYLDVQEVVELADPEFAPSGATPEPAAKTTASEARAVDIGPAHEKFAMTVRAAYEEAAAPLNLAQLANGLHASMRTEITGSEWFGSGSFRRAVERLDLPGATFSPHYLWDTSRHEAPKNGTSGTAIPAQISRFCEVTKLPRIASEQWPVVYQSLEAYAATHDFNLTEATKWSRDYATGLGSDVARSVFVYVVLACRDSGVMLSADVTPTPSQISSAVHASVLSQAEVAGLDVSSEDSLVLARWLHVEPSDSEAISTSATAPPA